MKKMGDKMERCEKTLTAHMIVMNEEKWIWYSIRSIIEHVDKLIIFDTGSTDATVKIIEWFLQHKDFGKKIIFQEKGCVTRQSFVRLRHEQVKLTDTDYFIVVDGDEIYYDQQLIEIKNAINSDENYECGIVNFVCCAGDVYHYRDPKKEHYCFDGKTGAMTMRVFSNNIEGIRCGSPDGEWDGYYDLKGNRIKPENGFKTLWVSGFYLHMSYLQRSSSIKKDAEIKWPGNRMIKLKNSSTWDFAFDRNFKFPEAFYAERPKYIEIPWKKQKNIIRIFLQILKNIKIFIEGDKHNDKKKNCGYSAIYRENL